MSSPTLTATRQARLAQRFQAVRQRTEALVDPLSPEDCQVQSMESASPVKWHLAHTTWFFETFVLRELPGYVPGVESYRELYNSYYQQVAAPPERHQRGLASRPSLQAVLSWRRTIDRALSERLTSSVPLAAGVLDRIALGLMHEEQHQELLLTDIKHALSFNAHDNAYLERRHGAHGQVLEQRFLSFGGGVYAIGTQPALGATFDNEGPAHEVLLQPFELSNRLVTNREYLQFIEDRGYERSELWLSEGFEWVQRKKVRGPMYWDWSGTDISVHTLGGTLPLELEEPVAHVSFFEADAFARWADARLPLEAEWEVAARSARAEEAPNDLSTERFHPCVPQSNSEGLHQLFGDVWEWTSSPYVAYPGFRPAPGVIGEYNGKFMCNQMVLRGGSCVTAADHSRTTYRNFFHADTRWQFSGLRLARDST